MTFESKIQLRLFHYLESAGHRLITPNKCLGSWEADLISVSASDLMWEFEIKSGRADFRADMKKHEKHKLYSACSKGPMKDWAIRNVPNKFYYVMTSDVVSAVEIPDHAGLVLIEGNNVPQFIKKAPSLHSNKVGPTRERQLGQSLSNKLFRTYWK